MGILLRSFLFCSFISSDFKAIGVKDVFYPPYDIFVFAFATFKYKGKCDIRMNWYIESVPFCEYAITLPEKHDDERCAFSAIDLLQVEEKVKISIYKNWRVELFINDKFMSFSNFRVKRLFYGFKFESFGSSRINISV
ncbi:hypothetical protein JCM14719A_00220 [Calditerricola satsumensis]|uniref:hypothetical protein n=1 Tax=Calditerricola satsumensis TaxID=373054 RepID=UPI001E5693B8|nr:hypothetical protein [Calditerricola satsumensis]